MNTHTSDYWVGTFVNVVKYIKERNAAAISETTINKDSLQMTLTDNLDNAIYNVPITVRRLLPSTWQDAKVYANNKVVPSTITTVNSKKYVMFDATPDQGKVYLSNPNKVVTGIEESAEEVQIALEPNPFIREIQVKAPAQFHFEVYSLEGKLLEEGEGVNGRSFGSNLVSGMYILHLEIGTKRYSRRIIKK